MRWFRTSPRTCWLAPPGLPAARGSIRGRRAGASQRWYAAGWLGEGQPPGASCGSRGRLGGGDRVGVVVLFVMPVVFLMLVVFLMVAVVPSAELNRSNVAGAEAAPPQLVRAGTDGIVPRISRLARRQQGEMPVAWSAGIREGAEARVPCQVAGEQGDGAAGRVTNQVVVQREDRARTIAPPAPGVPRDDCVLEERARPASIHQADAARTRTRVVHHGAVEEEESAVVRDARSPRLSRAAREEVMVLRNGRVDDFHRPCLVVDDPSRPGEGGDVLGNGAPGNEYGAR